MTDHRTNGGPGESEGWSGSPKPSFEVVMQAYDRLPPSVRRAVAEAALDWDSPTILAKLEAGTVRASDVIERIRSFEAEVARNRKG
jgi:hypothetical protein